MNFSDFDLSQKLLDGLDAMGFTKPTPIQEKAVPVILKHKDIIASAQTGTGKTAAFLLPILDKISRNQDQHINTLVLVPTRELALQIDQQVEGLGYFVGVSSISVYGGGDGSAWEQQRKALESGADIVIATPGRLIALLATGAVHFNHLQHLVLDEADRMLDMGFYEDLIKIVSHLPAKRQTLLFSATMPPRILTLAKRILHDPEHISIAVSRPADGILQKAFMLYDTQKIEALSFLLNQDHYNSIIIFASTKDSVKKLESILKRHNISAKAFHSDLTQPEREHIMRDFKAKRVTTIIGTDILSRGIDVVGIDLVVNYDVPPDAEDYVHRIGRTARAERTGTAITFINERDQQKFSSIERLIGREIPKEILPLDLGELPTYTPREKKKTNFSNRKPRRKGQHNRPRKNR